MRRGGRARARLTPLLILATGLGGWLALPGPVAGQTLEPAADPGAEPPVDESFSDLERALATPVLTTASQTLEDASVAPATSTTISAEELRRHGIQSLDQAINFLALGMLTQNPLHSVDVGARGVIITSDFGNHVLLLVNGHAVNEQWDGTAYFERGAAIPFELIDRIEIVLGPGSVLYGSNAMLGVVNIITRRARDWAGAHLVSEAELLTSLRLGAAYGHELQMFGHPAALTVAVEYYRQSGPDFRFGPQEVGDDAVTMAPKKFDPSGRNAGTWGGLAGQSYWTRVPAAHARLEVGELALELRGSSYTRGTPYLNQFNAFTGDFDNPDNGERDRYLSLDLKHHLTLSTEARLSSRLYGDLYDYRQRARSSAPEDCDTGQDSGCLREVTGLSRWTGLEEQLTFDWGGRRRLATLLGADGRLRYAGSQLDVKDAVTGSAGPSLGYVRRRESALGLYAQQSARPYGTFDVSAGARFDIDSRFGTHLSPRGAASVDVWSGAKLKGIYAEAFRAPTVYELYYADPANQVPAPDLRPETVRSVELLIEQRIGSHRLLLGGFASWWGDMVLLEALADPEVAGAVAAGALAADVTSAFQYRNASRLHNRGLNAALDGALAGGKLRYGLTFTAATARRHLEDGSALDLTVTPQIFGNGRLSYQPPSAAWPTLALAASFVGSRLADRAHDGLFTPVPRAPAQLELRAAATGALPVAGLSYRIVANLAAAAYNPYVAGPIQAATPEQPAAELAPVDRLRVSIGLQYDFGR